MNSRKYWIDSDYSTVRNQQQSPLLRLPPELRNKIYALAVGGQELVVLSDSVVYRSTRLEIVPKTYDDPKSRGPYHVGALHLTALLRVCRQLYEESASLHFALNTWHSTADDLILFLKQCGPRRNFIRTIIIEMGGGRLDAIDLKLLHILSQLQQLKRVVMRNSSAAEEQVSKEVQKLYSPEFLAKCMFEDCFA